MTTFEFILGNSSHILQSAPVEKAHMVFVDPPYNIQTTGPLLRPDASLVEPIDSQTSTFASLAAYDVFTQEWLRGVRNHMREDGTIWVMGTYHNIFRIGKLMQDMGFWVLATVAWHKPNAMPNFSGRRLKSDVEFIIWARYAEHSSYTFHYHDTKARNGGKQLGSVWEIAICTGAERLRGADGEKLHPTQKPEALLQRIIRMSTNPGDLILDPFAGTGTTAAVARQLGRRSRNIEQQRRYLEAAQQRVATLPDGFEEPARPIEQLKVAFGTLLELELVQVGQVLYLRNSRHTAIVQPGGKLMSHGHVGSIHQVACRLKNLPACNGWNHWDYRDPHSGERQRIDALRQQARAMLQAPDEHPLGTSTP